MKQWKIATIVVLILVGILCSYFYINDHEAAAVASRYEEFYQALTDKHYELAFNMTSPKYRKDNDLEVFKKDFSFADETWLKLKPGYNVRFKGNSAWLYPRESNLFELWVGPEYEWIKVHDKWYLTGKYEWYLD